MYVGCKPSGLDSTLIVVVWQAGDKIPAVLKFDFTFYTHLGCFDRLIVLCTIRFMASSYVLGCLLNVFLGNL